ncbi:MAG: hypothetical protein ABMA01_21015, partial [Chthoniobacteraceae bacterium]
MLERITNCIRNRRKGAPEATEEPRLVLPREVVFPNAQHSPAQDTERARHQPIAGLVLGEFAPPEGRIV